METITDLRQWASGSKIVDARGNLLVLWHASPSPLNFDQFRVQGTTYKGIYASVRADYATTFGEHVRSLWASIKNPFRINMDNRNSPHFATKHGEIVLGDRIVGFYRHLEDRTIQVLTAHGYDGIVATHDGIDFFEVVAFSPQQVRWADPDRSSTQPISTCR